MLRICHKSRRQTPARRHEGSDISQHYNRLSEKRKEIQEEKAYLEYLGWTGSNRYSEGRASDTRCCSVCTMEWMSDEREREGRWVLKESKQPALIVYIWMGWIFVCQDCKLLWVWGGENASFCLRPLMTLWWRNQVIRWYRSLCLQLVRMNFQQVGKPGSAWAASMMVETEHFEMIMWRVTITCRLQPRLD